MAEPRIVEFIPSSKHGNLTALDIDAPPDRVWSALHEIRLADCRLTTALLAVRSIPVRIRRRGALDAAVPRQTPAIEAMAGSRFGILHEEAGSELVIGVIGQFWRLSGGHDASFEGAKGFLAFDTSGYVKVAMDFRIEATATGTRLSTETRCVSTDPATARTFGRYWKVIGIGSKAIRIDLLRAVRRSVS